MRRIAALSGVIAGLLATAGAAAADPAPPLQPAKKTGEVIVRFHDQAGGSVRAAARRSVETSSARRLLLANTQVLKVPAGTARAASRELEQLGSVVWAEPNLPVKGGAAPSDDPYFDQLWGLRNTGQAVDGHSGVPGVDVNALPAWDTTRGAGTLVAVVDSGVAADHPEIAPAIWTNPGEVPGNDVDDDGNGLVDDIHGWDFWDSDNDPDDYHSHGTHVAGTIAARANNGTGIAGVAPETKVMPVRVLNDSNAGRTADVANGIAYAALMGADVINLSVGTPPEPDFPLPQAERDALDVAAAHDTLVVVAAMNDSQDNDTGHSPIWPCNFPDANVLCVAAIDSDGGLSSFSNWGAQSVDVAAPGRSILSLNPDWFRLSPPGVEEFESGISTRWYGAGGWAGTTAFAATGSWSLTDSPAGNYANDTTPWAAMTNGVDLTGQHGCRINYAVRGKVLAGDYFVTGMLDHDGAGHVTYADSVDTHGEFETHSDGISVVDGDPDVHGVFQLNTDASGTADGVYVDDLRFICRASEYDGDSYFYNEGTSMATPHVSGVAALVRAAVPGATAAQVAQAIREGAVKLDSLAGKTVTGGRADAPGAIEAARRLARPPSQPPATPPSGSQGLPADQGGRRAAIAVTYRAPRAGVIRARGIAIVSNRLTEVAHATRKVRRAGRVKLTLKMSAAANRALASQGSLKVRVSVTFKPKQGRAKTTTRTVTLQP
jgi:subtilisin family serine protease